MPVFGRSYPIRPTVLHGAVSTGGPWTILPGQATETDVAQAVTRQKIKAVGLVTETDTSQHITSGPAKGRTAGLATETDTVFVAQKINVMGQATETDTVFAVTKRKRKTPGQATETDLAQAATGRVIHRTTITAGLVTETDTVPGPVRFASFHLGLPTETDTVFAVTFLFKKRAGLPLETETAFHPTPKTLKRVGLPTESDAALTILDVHPPVPHVFPPKRYYIVSNGRRVRRVVR